MTIWESDATTLWDVEERPIFRDGYDHGLIPVTLRKGLVVHTKSGDFTEFAGEESLNDGDQIVEAWIVDA